ncbi:MAG: hypothetical protein WCS85_03720 [Candidatus Peribacteraceae bacterium]|jgi:hypothetical protein
MEHTHNHTGEHRLIYRWGFHPRGEVPRDRQEQSAEQPTDLEKKRKDLQGRKENLVERMSKMVDLSKDDPNGKKAWEKYRQDFLDRFVTNDASMQQGQDELHALMEGYEQRMRERENEMNAADHEQKSPAKGPEENMDTYRKMWDFAKSVEASVREKITNFVSLKTELYVDPPKPRIDFILEEGGKVTHVNVFLDEEPDGSLTASYYEKEGVSSVRLERVTEQPPIRNYLVDFLVKKAEPEKQQ